MDTLNYLLLINIYLVLFYAFYALFLKNETFFQLNRIYLVGGACISFLIPFLQSEWIRSLFITKQVEEVTQNISLTFSSQPLILQAEEKSWAAADVLLFIYLSGAAFFLIRFLWQLYKLQLILRSDGTEQAFSFFHKVKVGSEILNRETVYDHEMVHARQWHSADVILFELISIVNWFNPVVYLYRKAIKYIHEFMADEVAAGTEQSKSKYAMLLLSNTFGIPANQISNSFFNHSLLKRRIIMLHKSKSARTALWKYGFSAPLFVGMLIFSSACVKPETAEKGVKFSPPVIEVSEEIIEVSDEVVLPPTLRGALYPEFPGGMSAFIEFVSKNYKYPSQAIKNNLTGEIITSFVIEKDGSLTGIQVVKDLGYGTGKEAIRMLKTSPKWKPGMQNGKAVSVGYTLPIKIDQLKVGQDRLKVDAMIFEWKLKNDNE